MGDSIRRVAVLAPMPSEYAPVVKALGLRARADGFGHHDSVGNVDVVAATTGIGTASAASATKRVLDAFDVDHVLVVGIAGGIADSHVGDLVLPATVVDQTTGTAFASAPLAGRIARGTIATSDELIVQPAAVQALVAQGVVALDMETAAVATVCSERGVPWSAIRVISDRAEDHVDDAVMTMANADGSPNLGAALRFIARHPGRVPSLVRLARGARSAASAAAVEAAAQIGAIRA